MCLTVGADEHLIKMPAPQRIGSMTNTAFPDLGGKQRTKTVPPVPHGLMANVDAPFEQKIFDLSQRQGVADIQHHRAADYLRRIVEITKGILHRRRLRNLTSRLKPIYSNNALPAPHAGLGLAGLAHDRRSAEPLVGLQDDPRPPDMFLRALRGRDDRL